MRDVRRWLAGATRSLAVDLVGRERRAAARARLRTLLTDLVVVGCVLVVVVAVVAVAGLAVGVAVASGTSVPVLVAAWAVLMAQLAFVPLVAMRVGSAVYTRLG
jgi:Flp pilus assembly protein TadB